MPTSAPDRRTSERPRSRANGIALATVAAIALLLAMLARFGPAVAERVAEATPTATPSAAATPARDSESGLRLVELAALPAEARRTVQLIDGGGPFPYAKDGSVFGNRERLLPAKPSGFYHEYTVPTPGEDDRGARRIIAGDGTRQLFYTADHYASFVRVRR